MTNLLSILFDNKNYNIDKASLPALSTLKSHLANVMSGSGATINFDGTQYNVDSTKLSNARNAFTTHLGTVVGNGYKVVVNGVEYNIDSNKMAQAVADLHAVLSGLHSGDSIGDIQAEKNKYGFYYNVPYIKEFENGYIEAIVFYDTNMYGETLYVSFSNDFFTGSEFYGSGCYLYAYDESSGIITDELGRDFIPSNDGKTLIYDSHGEFPQYDGTTYSAAGAEHGVYYDYEYVSKNGDILIFHYFDGIYATADYKTSSGYQFLSDIELDPFGHTGWYNDRLFSFSIDGNVLYMTLYDDDGTEIRFERGEEVAPM